MRLTAQLAKTDLLILDDWGLEKLTLTQRNDLLDIMEDRHGSRSTMITIAGIRNEKTITAAFKHINNPDA